jgi:hypothetical protein
MQLVRWEGGIKTEQPAARDRAPLARGRRCARCSPAAGSADLLPVGGEKSGAAAMLVLLSARSVRDARAAGQGLLLLRGSAARAVCAQLWGIEASSARDARAAGRGPVAGKWGPAQRKRPELL